MNKQTDQFISNQFFAAIVSPEAIGIDTDTAYVLICMAANDDGLERRLYHNMLFKLSLGPVVSPNDDTDTVYLSSGEVASAGVLGFILEKELVVSPITASISANGNPLSELGMNVLKILDKHYGPCAAAREKTAANTPKPTY
jgi:hypothetical protein